MRGSGHRRFVIGVYRMALRVLPADLRRRSGSAIASTFARRLDEAALAAQVWSRLRFALAELADVVQTGARMRFEGLLSRRAVGIMAAGAAVALVLASPASRTALPASGPEAWMDRLESSASARTACAADFDGDGRSDLRVSVSVAGLPTAGVRGGESPTTIRLSREELSRLRALSESAATCD